MAAPDRTARALAGTFRIHIVANGHPGDFVEPTGRSNTKITTVNASTDWGKAHGALMKHADLDLDSTFIHQDNNCAKLIKMCKEYPGRVVFEIDGCVAAWRGGGHPGCETQSHPDDPPDNGVMLLRAVDRTVSVRSLCEAYGVETDRDYIWRQRQAVNSLRQAGEPCPGPPGEQ